VIDGEAMAVWMLVLFAGPAALLGQAQSAAAAPDASCGGEGVSFKVDMATGSAPTQPLAGKALVVFIEKDVGASVASTTLAGMDGQWTGATHGNSWFAFAVDPGMHHLCAQTHFSGWIGGGAGMALLHFNAQAGRVYYFEAKNLGFSAERQTDVSLTQVDADEGRFLMSTEKFVASRRKK
jgi:hypothetical protein